MPRRLLRAFALSLVLAFGLLTAPAARAATDASAVARGFYDQLAATLKQGEQLGFEGRYQKLDAPVRAAFNLPLMAKMSAGSAWSAASQKEQTDLVEAFSAFSVATYASRFAKDDGLQFEVIGEKTTPQGVTVETRLKPKDGEAVALNYLMRPDDSGQYRIVDVYLNGTISELATRRAEFSAIARKDGMAALVGSLQQKTKQMGQS